MVRVIKITEPECLGCMGASFGDCPNCETRTQEITLCMDCDYRDESVMYREKLLCKKLHAWSPMISVHGGRQRHESPNHYADWTRVICCPDNMVRPDRTNIRL